MTYIWWSWMCLKQRQSPPQITNRRENVGFSFLIMPNKFSCNLLLWTWGRSNTKKLFLLTEFGSKREELEIAISGDHVWVLLVVARVREMLNLACGHPHLCFLNEDKYENYLHQWLLGVEHSCIFGRCFISKKSSLFWKLERPRAPIIVWFLKHCLHAVWVSCTSHA